MREEQTATEAFEGPHSGNNGTGNGDGAPRSPDLGFLAHSNLPIQVHPAFEAVLDSEEAAALLKIHPKTLQRLARNGKIPGFRIGKLWGFRASALNRWLESKTPT